MPVKFYQIDAFTDKPFQGNPAAVCILTQAADNKWMQNIAAEMNLSETAFLYPLDNGYSLRWFTPAAEVDLCGHATLAGVNEDPVTGSAHCCLAPYWQKKLGRDQMVAYQASVRGGVVKVKVKGDRVAISGQAITVMEGQIF